MGQAARRTSRAPGPCPPSFERLEERALFSVGGLAGALTAASPASRGNVLDPVQRSDRPSVDRVHPGQGDGRASPRQSRDTLADHRAAGNHLGPDRRVGDGHDEAGRLTPDGGQDPAPESHGSSRSHGPRSETDPAGDVALASAADATALAADPSGARDSSGGGTADTSESATPDRPVAAVDLVWAGRSGVSPGVGTFPAGPDAAGGQVVDSPAWHPPAAAGDPEVLAGPDDSEPAGPGAAGGEGPAPGPQLADLVAGVLPFDASALARGAEQFFAHLQGLGHDPAAASLARRFAPWLATGALAAAAVELARRQREKPTPRGPGLTPG